MRRLIYSLVDKSGILPTPMTRTSLQIISHTGKMWHSCGPMDEWTNALTETSEKREITDGFENISLQRDPNDCSL